MTSLADAKTPPSANRDERIRQRAHELWELAGRPHGQDADHWLQAEQEIGLEPEEPGASVNVIEGVARDVEPAGTVIHRKSVPITSGASKPAPDTSRTPMANRDVEGPRKASTTPRPTDEPLA